MEFYISPQSGQFYMINVLENQWLSVTYNTLFLRLILGDLKIAFPHQQFLHTTKSFTQSGYTVKLLLLCLHTKQGGSLYHFYDDLWYDLAGMRTYDLPHGRETCQSLSHPDTVLIFHKDAKL